MFTVTVRDHVMIAHSFQGALFGPAQRLHGATYVVDVEFRAEELDPNGVVIDIGAAVDAPQGGAGALGLSQSRRSAGIQGHQHHHRIPRKGAVRQTRRRNPRRQTGPSRR